VAEADASADGIVSLTEMERRHIARVLEAEKGNVDRASRVLGISRSSLYQKTKAYGLSRAGEAGA